MNIHLMKIVSAAITLLLCASFSFAVELKTADIKGSANANASKVKTDAKAAVKGKLLDINSATEYELQSIPGISDAIAAKIIAGRPYANKAQLKSRGILTAVVYEQVKENLIAKQPKKSPVAKKSK